MRSITRCMLARLAGPLRRVAPISRASSCGRSLAILPQPPVLSKNDKKKALKLRRSAERAVVWQVQSAREQLTPPQFSRIGRPTNVLKLYAQKRDLLSPHDTAAALFTLGKLNRASALKVKRDPLAEHPLAFELRADVAVSAPYLSSRDLANSLLAAAYMRSSDEAMLSALCSVRLPATTRQPSAHARVAP